MYSNCSSKEFEDTKGVIRIHIWTKEKVQKDKQRSTKHTHKTKDRVTSLIMNKQIVLITAKHCQMYAIKIQHHVIKMIC